MSSLSPMPDFSGLPAMPTNTLALQSAQRIWDPYEETVRATERQIEQAWSERQRQLYGDPVDLEASALVEMFAFLDSDHDD